MIKDRTKITVYQAKIPFKKILTKTLEKSKENLHRIFDCFKRNLIWRLKRSKQRVKTNAICYAGQKLKVIICPW